jgi:hypothetical protein
LACLDDARLAGEEDVLRNFAARFEREAGQRHAVRTASQLEFEPVLLVGEHDEAALGPGHLDGRIEHQREHFVEHTSGSQRPKPLEKARQLADVADGRGLRPIRQRWRRDILNQEHDVGARRPPELDAIAVTERLLRHLFTVDERPVPRPSVLQNVAAIRGRDLCVIARDVASRQAQVVFVTPSDGDNRLVDRDDATTETVVDFKAWT